MYTALYLSYCYLIPQFGTERRKQKARPRPVGVLTWSPTLYFTLTLYSISISFYLPVILTIDHFSSCVVSRGQDAFLCGGGKSFSRALTKRNLATRDP